MREAKYVKSLTISLSEQVYQQIKSYSDTFHISMGDTVREAIDKMMESEDNKEASRVSQ
ncbi:MAG: hypothetical protein WCU00_02675 [Candidatus Latescibacterota bacterium]